MANPVLSKRAFTQFRHARAVDRSETMTIQGTVNKTLVLLLLVIFSSTWTFYQYLNTERTDAVLPWVIVGTVGGLIAAIATSIKKEWAPITAPLYALLEGLALGGISALFEQEFPGIVVQAVVLTFGTLIMLLAAYRSGIIKATENFKLGVTAATGGIFLMYLLTFILGLFGISMPYIHDNGWIGIGISLAIVIVAALNLVIDFDFIEGGAKVGAPKYMEWYGAFALMVTLIWLYLEILRLLAKMRSRD
jgi:uncharacterized YccA/Bax inhibitor family protein